MTQTTNRLLDDLAKLMTDAAGAAEGVKREVATLMRAQAERILREMDVVKREEFEAVKAMVEKARAENERLEQRLAALEAQPRRESAGLTSRTPLSQVSSSDLFRGPSQTLAPSGGDCRSDRQSTAMGAL